MKLSLLSLPENIPLKKSFHASLFVLKDSSRRAKAQRRALRDPNACYLCLYPYISLQLRYFVYKIKLLSSFFFFLVPFFSFCPPFLPASQTAQHIFTSIFLLKLGRRGFFSCWLSTSTSSHKKNMKIIWTWEIKFCYYTTAALPPTSDA